MESLKLVVDIGDSNTNDLTLSVITELAWTQHKPQIREWFQNLLIDGYDIDTYEGGIEDWFGLGSVMLYELGVSVNFQVSDNHHGIDLILS